MAAVIEASILSVTQKMAAILIAVMCVYVASSLTPVNCSYGPNLTVASFGEHVWNCTSPSTSVGGDVLRIVVPSPTANASGLLSVEVRMSTFQQIIIDVGNAVQPQQSVNVSIVLCGAPLLVGSATRNVLNLTDRPLAPAITITDSSGQPSNLPSAGLGVLVVVIVDRDVVLWMRNVLSLILVKPAPVESSQFLDVTVVLHSGSLVELHDVPHFVVGNAERTRLVFTAFNATIQSAVATSTALTAAVSVLSLNASGGGASIDVNITRCDVSIVQLPLPDARSHFLLLQGDIVVTAKVNVAFTRCNISIVSPLSNVLTVLANITSTVTNLSVASYATNIYCGQSVVSITANSSLHTVNAAVSIHSSNVTVGGSFGALMFLQSSSGSVFLSNAIVTIDGGSAVDFAGDGYPVVAFASTNCSAHDVTATVRSSNVAVGGGQGALSYIKSINGSVFLSNAAATIRSSKLTVGGGLGSLLYIQSSSDSVLLSNATATVNDGGVVGFVGYGYLIVTFSSTFCNVSGVAVMVRSSNVTVGGSLGSLMYVQSHRGGVLLSNANATVDDGSAVNFIGEGYLVFALASTKCIASDVAVTVRSSHVTVGGNLGTLFFVGSSNATRLSIATATIDVGSVVGFAANGYLVFTFASTSCNTNDVTTTVRSSNVTVGGGQGALLFLKCSNGSVLLSNAIATIGGGSAVDFAGDGYLVAAFASTNCSTRDVTVTLLLSTMTVGGNLGALLFLKCPNGSVLLSNATAKISRGSAVGFVGEGYLVLVLPATNCSAFHVTASVLSSNVTVSGSLGAMVYIISPSGSVLLSNAVATVGGKSTIGFAAKGYLALAFASTNSGASDVSATVLSSNVTVGGNQGALLYVGSSIGSVLLFNATATVDGGSAVGFKGYGSLVFAFSSMSCNTSDVAVTVRSSKLTVGGGLSALFYAQSSSGSVLLCNATATVDGGSSVSFVGEGYLVIALAGTNCNISDVAAMVRSSDVTVSGSLGVLLHIKSLRGDIVLSNATATVDEGSAVSFVGYGSLVYALATTSCSASDVTATVRSSNVTVGGGRGALTYGRSSNGSVLLSNATATIEAGSAVGFVGEGYLILALASTSCNASDVTATVRSSNVTVGGSHGGLLLFNGSTVLTFSVDRILVDVSDSSVGFRGIGRVVDFSSFSPALFMRIAVDHSTLLVSEVVSSLLAMDVISFLLHESTVVVTGRFLFVEVLPTCPTVRSVWIAMTNSLVLIVSPISRLHLIPPTRCPSNITFSSSCSLIGWTDNVTAAAMSHRGLEWTVGVANKFFSGRLNDMPLSLRALRKLDVVGADRVTVTAERCAWGRGSREFRATDSVSETASSSSSRSLHTGGTTLFPSTTISVQQIGVVKRSILTVRGIGSTVLFIAAASVVSSSASTVLPGVQIIGQRSALLSQCDAFNAADGVATAVVPPLSDPASNPFGVTIGSLGDELMFAGGSAVSSILLALMYGAVTVVLALLLSPREWLRSVRIGPLAALRLPGSLYAPLALVLQPLTVAAVVLVSSSWRNVASVVFGVLLLAMTLAPLCALLWRVWDGRRQQLLLWEVKASRQNSCKVDLLGAALPQLAEAVFADRYECVPRSSHDRASQLYFERYGVVVASYASSREWFVGVEVAAAVLSGALSGVASGLDPSFVCSVSVIDGFNWALAALSVALLLVVALCRPYSSHFGNAQSGLSSLLAAVCLALQSLSPDSSAIAALTWVQSALGFLPLVYLLLPKTSAVCGDGRGGLTCNGVDGTVVHPVELSLLLTEAFDAAERKSPSGQRSSHRGGGNDHVLSAIIEVICARRQSPLKR